jgi:hypothetical protein
MDLLVSHTPDRFQARRRLKRNDFEPIPPRYMAVVSHHLAGRSAREVAELTGYKLPTIYKILSDQRVTQLRQQVLKATQDEFEALFPKAVENIRTFMSAPEVDTQVKGTDMWLRANGKYRDSGVASQVNITAEDIVFNILNQAPQEDGREASPRSINQASSLFNHEIGGRDE